MYSSRSTLSLCIQHNNQLTNIRVPKRIECKHEDLKLRASTQQRPRPINRKTPSSLSFQCDDVMKTRNFPNIAGTADMIGIKLPKTLLVGKRWRYVLLEMKTKIEDIFGLNKT